MKYLLASVALVVAVVACGHTWQAGEDCSLGQHTGVVDTDPCKQSGLVCIYDPGGAEVCAAAAACKADSDCPSNFGCSAVDAYDGTTYCATRCKEGCDGYPVDVNCAACAAGYGCAADGVSCEYRLGKSCYVTDTSGAGCGAGAACSAVTRVCTLSPQCKADSDCGGGFECLNDVCQLSCTPDTTGDPTADTGCAPGFACNPQTFTCSSTLGGPCNPASDDGNQCGLGGACSPASQTCVAATPCNTDADCAGYGCQNGYCLLTCTKNVLPCAIGKTCDLNAHTCS